MAYDKSKAAMEARKRYRDNKVDVYSLQLPKGTKQLAIDAARKKGTTLSAYLNECVEVLLEDLQK